MSTMCRVKVKKITDERYRLWTQEENKILMREIKAQKTTVNIGKLLNRTYYAICYQIKYLRRECNIDIPIRFKNRRLHDYEKFTQIWNNATCLTEVKEAFPEIPDITAFASKLRTIHNIKLKKLSRRILIDFDHIFERLKSKKIITESGCWELNRKKTKIGYYSMRYIDKRILLHRLSFSFYKNCKCLLPSTYLVCHVCNNCACWNPEHLKVGDALENALDRSENVA
jgi:hypothetical protein